MKLMQLNTWEGRLLGRLLPFLKAENPDILLTQEMFSYPTSISFASPWKQFRTLQLIAEQNGYDHVYFSPTSSFDMLGHKLSYGNAIFSRLPITSQHTVYTSGPGPLHYREPRDFQPNKTRNFQHVTLQAGGKSLHLINHHGHRLVDPQGDKTSVTILRSVGEYIAKLEGPVIAGGDFNVEPTSPAVAAFLEASKLTDHTSRHTQPGGTLSPAHYTTGVACDYLFSTPDIHVENIRLSEQIVSDHKAVIADVSL